MKKGLGPIAVLFARPPAAGRTKTRLAAAIGEEAALALYTAFLLDSLEILRRLSPEGVRAGIAWAEPPDATAARTFAPHLHGFEPMSQHGDDLGQRMSGAIADLLARGHDRVVLLGADTPSLPVEFVIRAFTLLRDRDLVIGPSTDGGYYLIGARAIVPEIFRKIPWGTDRVLPETLAILKILGLPRVLLPEWSDIDSAEDLQSLRLALADLGPDDPTARHTRAALAGVPG